MSLPKGRATNADDRARILKMIEVAWNACPNLRLGQLLSNAHSGDLFYVEDEDLGKDVAQYAHKARAGS